MLFADLFFIYFFLPVCLIFYFASKNIRWRNCVLAVFSLIFYAWGEPVFILLLLASITVNYFLGRLFDFLKLPDTDNGEKISRLRKLTLAAGIFCNLAALGIFKYGGIFITALNSVFSLNLPSAPLSLPLGISFYTFKAISYLVDCYSGEVRPQRSYGKFLIYISIFPQLVAGPITRWGDIADEIDDRRTGADDIYDGTLRVITGLAKKVIIADSLASVVGEAFGGSMTAAAAWYGAALYALQIYFDFSGYSDISIGLSRIFGFHIKENFNYPFVSKTVGEFWRRWHISLGEFFREYLLYIPIFGKRRGYFNLFLVWFCTGVWHGAGWNYIIWGLYFGTFVFIESLIGKKRINKIPPVLSHIYASLVFTVGFGIFYFEDISRLGVFLRGLIGLSGGLYDGVIINIIANNCFLVGAALLFSLPVIPALKKLFGRRPSAAFTANAAACAFCAVLLFISSAMLVNATNHPFLYFKW